MTATSMSRMVVPFMAFVTACGVALVFAVDHVRREPPADTKAATIAPVVSKPASDVRDQGPAALAAAQAEAKAVSAGLAGNEAIIVGEQLAQLKTGDAVEVKR